MNGTNPNKRLSDWWPFKKAELPNSLSQFFQRSEGKQAAKWLGYLQHYDRHLGPLKDKPISLLEIGIQAGGSLKIWANYFQSSPLIIGCDVDPKCKDLHYTDERIKVLIGDINSPSTLTALDSLTNAIDVIVDDGSHQSQDIITSFVNLFPRLAEGGVYLIEDLHCSYWENYGGGLHSPTSALAFFKKIVDVINHSVWGVDAIPNDFLSEFKESLSAEKGQDWGFLHGIHSIEFVNSICVIRKCKPEHNMLGKLVLSGRVGPQINSVFGYAMTEMNVPDQSQNIFSQQSTQALDAHAKNLILHDEIKRLKQVIFKTQLEANQLTTQVYEATKQFYDASVTIQQLEFKIKQLEQPNEDAV